MGDQPAAADRVESILFVCLGNICRSPFAAALASRRLCEGHGAAVRCASAGIRTSQAARPPDHACEVAASYGLVLTGHRPVMLTRDLLDAHDLVVVMETGQMTELRATYPHAKDRIALLSLFDPEPASIEDRYVIGDPFSREREAFERCYRHIDRTVSQLLAAVSVARIPPSSRGKAEEGASCAHE